MKQTIILRGNRQRSFAKELIERAPQDHVVRISEGTRTLEQNALLWALLTDLSEQVQWPVNGQLQSLSPEDWKDLSTAALKQESRIAQGMDGGAVFLGRRTSRMGKREFSDLLEVIMAFGSAHGVKWSDDNGQVG